jgi:hypothetical protein
MIGFSMSVSGLGVLDKSMNVSLLPEVTAVDQH